MPVLMGAIALAYLLGSLSGSLLIGRVRGVDIRRQGSGNAGGTNAFRTQGWRFAICVVMIDVGKGVAATWLGLHVAAAAPAPIDTAYAQAALCGFAAVVGHCWPVFFGFRGGKGAATAAGVVVVLAPALVLPLMAVWVLVLIATGYVGLSTIVAAGAFALLAATTSWVPDNAVSTLSIFALAIALLVAFTHRSNVVRLVRGEEYRFNNARLLHRLLRRA